MSDVPDSSPSGQVTPMTVLRRGWPALIVFVILGALAGALVQKHQVVQYQSTATVYVASTGVGNTSQSTNGRTTTEVDLDTESNLVTSSPVLDRTRKLLKTKDTDGVLAGRITVTVPSNTQLMKITYTSPTAKGAQAGANAVTKSYLADRLATAQAYQAANIKLIQHNIDVATAALKKATAAAAKYTSTSAAGRLAAIQESQLNHQISTLTDSLGTTRNTVVQAGNVTVSATVPSTQSKSAKILFIASGAAVGILLGVVAAWLLARRPIRKLKRANDVDGLLGLPVIAQIKDLQLDHLTPSSTPTGEAFRRLVNVVNASLSGDSRVIVVAGVDNSSAATTVTHNMAATLSRSGERVAVLNPAGADTSASAMEALDSSYRILPSTGPRTRKAVDELREQEEGFILIDAPEASRSADAQSYGAVADAIVIVVPRGTRTKAVRALVAEFDAVAAPVLGAILVDVSARTAPAADAVSIGLTSPVSTQDALPAGQAPPASAAHDRRRSARQAPERPAGPHSATARRIAQRTERLRAGRD